VSRSRMFLKKPKRLKIPRSIRMLRTYWNGEPAECRKVRVRMGPAEPTWWCAGMEGQIREAVRVDYRGDVFYIDNEGIPKSDGHINPGDGWLKVTLGMGAPGYRHASISICVELDHRDRPVGGGEDPFLPHPENCTGCLHCKVA